MKPPSVIFLNDQITPKFGGKSINILSLLKRKAYNSNIFPIYFPVRPSFSIKTKEFRRRNS